MTEPQAQPGDHRPTVARVCKKATIRRGTDTCLHRTIDRPGTRFSEHVRDWGCD